MMVIMVAMFLSDVTFVNHVHSQEKLRWKFAQGDKFKVAFDQEIIQETEFNRKPQKLTIKMNLEMNWKVNSVEQNGNAKIDQEFTKMKISWSVNDAAPLVFDSSSDAEREGLAKRIADLLTPILKAKVTSEMSPRGEYVRLELDKKTMDHLRNAPDSMSIRNLFTKEGLTKTITQSSLVLPEKGIKKGDTWESISSEKGAGGTMKYVRTYTFDGTTKKGEDELASIKVAGKIAFSPTPQKLRKPQVITKNSQSGELLFDNQNGNFVSGTLNLEIQSETPVQDFKIKAGTNSKLTTRIERVK